MVRGFRFVSVEIEGVLSICMKQGETASRTMETSDTGAFAETLGRGKTWQQCVEQTSSGNGTYSGGAQETLERKRHTTSTYLKHETDDTNLKTQVTYTRLSSINEQLGR